MVRRARPLLGALIADAQERGLVAQNVVRSLRTSPPRQGRERRAATQEQAQDRHRHPDAGRDARDHRQAPRASMKPHATGRCCSPRSSPACAPPSCAACAGPTSISSAASCMSASGPIGTARSGGRSRKPASAPCRCRRWWSPCCASIGSPARRASLVSSFPNSQGGIDHRDIIVEHGFHPAQVAAGVVNGTAKPSIPACTASAISMPPGASTGASTAGLSCRSRWCRRGSVTPRSR